MKTNCLNEYGKASEAEKMKLLRLIPVGFGILLMVALML